jgi:hypothetical protein
MRIQYIRYTDQDQHNIHIIEYLLLKSLISFSNLVKIIIITKHKA